jgi:hypothetical protein
MGKKPGHVQVSMIGTISFLKAVKKSQTYACSRVAVFAKHLHQFELEGNTFLE